MLPAAGVIRTETSLEHIILGKSVIGLRALRQEGYVYRVRLLRMQPSVRRAMSAFQDSYTQLGHRHGPPDGGRGPPDGGRLVLR